MKSSNLNVGDTFMVWTNDPRWSNLKFQVKSIFENELDLCDLDKAIPQYNKEDRSCSLVHERGVGRFLDIYDENGGFRLKVKKLSLVSS